MLAKDAGARPTAGAVYEKLLPLTTGLPRTATASTAEASGKAAEVQYGDEDRDPTRPFRRPLLAPTVSRPAPAKGRNKLTDTEAEQLQNNIRAPRQRPAI
jgi:hypothetical protein